MKTTHNLAAWALLAYARAQTPSNFSVVSTAPLEVIGQPGNIKLTPGLLVPQSDVLNVPSITLPRNASNGSYAAFMIDPTTSVGTFLHWFQPNLVPSANGTLTIDIAATNASTAVGATYIYPQPQADGYAHQYVVLVYQQPANWAVPSNYSRINPPANLYARFPFDMADFQRAAGLSDPVGTDYFRVLNGTAEQTSSLAGATASATMASGSSSAAATTASASGVASKTGNAAATKGMHDVAAAGWAGMLALPLLL